MKNLSSILLATGLLSTPTLFTNTNWQLGPFTRIEKANPILTPSKSTTFNCPVQHKKIEWESEHVFNPGAIVHKGKVYLFYRAEDDYGIGIGYHTSRIGLAISKDGINFKRSNAPILFPNNDDQKSNEFPGGCEDPRIVETENKTFVMTYSQWNREISSLGIATSNDLIKWKKHGYAFKKQGLKIWAKSGSIVCRIEEDHLIATKIQGKYWMYWGDLHIHLATSDDLISWDILLDKDKSPVNILSPRNLLFDSSLVEPGPPAIITEKGILLLYNGRNSTVDTQWNPLIKPGTYSAGQVLFDKTDPTKVIDRCEKHFLTPEKSYETKGQYTAGTVFIQGLVPFKKQWFLYYGTADSGIAVATCKDSLK